MMIKLLTKKLEDEATQHGHDEGVEANDKDLPHDGQPTAGQLGHDPHDAGETIIQHACGQ